MKYLQNIFFYIFFFFLGLIVGAFVASWTITIKTGFTGGATLVFYGVIGAFLGLILSVRLNRKIKKVLIRNVISILGAAFLISVVLFIRLALNFD
ncbi:MAG: hypothetical protein AB8B73_05655 [Ekhidna sp.]